MPEVLDIPKIVNQRGAIKNLSELLNELRLNKQNSLVRRLVKKQQDGTLGEATEDMEPEEVIIMGDANINQPQPQPTPQPQPQPQQAAPPQPQQATSQTRDTNILGMFPDWMKTAAAIAAGAAGYSWAPTVLEYFTSKPQPEPAPVVQPSEELTTPGYSLHVGEAGGD